jgi:hydroxyacylglutathione hydrolase
MEKNEKTNILVISIGVALIFLIGLFIAFKPYFNKKNVQKENVADNSAYVNDLKKAKKITGEDLRKKILTGGKNTVIIDIRDEFSFAQEHIQDSVNIPYSNIQDALASLDKTKTYILVDDGSSFLAASLAGGIFTTNNFSNVFYLSGGFIAWKNKINLTVSTGDPSSFIDQSKVNYINSDDLKKLIETNGNNTYILDVRDKTQFDLGHIRNASNIYLGDLEKKRFDIPRGKKIILCDDNGFMAFQAGVRLFDLGFFNVEVFSDGLNTWKEKGYEIVN